MHAAFIIIAILVVAGVAYLGYLNNKKRREAFQRWAASRGWTYTEEDNSLTDRFEGNPFGKGDHRRAKNVVTGRHENRPVVAFDYSYQTHSTDSEGHRTTTTHRFNVVSIGLPVSLPNLEVGREGLFNKMGRALGFHDIEFENGEFNKKFNISCDDRKLAYDVLHPRMMQWLLDNPGPAWRVERSDLLCWDSGRVSPEVIDRQVAYLATIADQVPRFVWQDRGATPPNQ
ncbi:MAG TPA: DUF3137 domain-containing protein [Mycobacteriales bacterium]|jgi:hypothetical protein|nr:DUF3137 domain-containing protein [Mycobacteriales bacterium]